jgi:hypothetical protein
VRLSDVSGALARLRNKVRTILLLEISANKYTEEEARRYAARPFNPDYHYVHELAGWYDTDEECEERNRADDVIEMIEGD